MPDREFMWRRVGRVVGRQVPSCRLSLVGVLPLLTFQPLLAQVQPGAATTQPVTTRPVTELEAEVVEVSGDVSSAAVGADVLDADAWAPLGTGDKLASGTQIRTGLRSYVILLFGDDTVVSVRRATLASIDHFYASAAGRTIQLGLGYGAVRGGTTEGTVRSDVVVDSPVATLAKRGTEGWEMEVEPYTGRFRISLARSGLIEALQKHTGERRLVRTGEYATELNIAMAWIKQAIFDRTIRFVESDAVTEADLDFSTYATGGFAEVAPGIGSEARSFVGRPGRAVPPPINPTDIFIRLQQARAVVDTLVIERPPFVPRAEGNFGVPRARLLFDSRDAARFRRSR